MAKPPVAPDVQAEADVFVIVPVALLWISTADVWGVAAFSRTTQCMSHCVARL